MLRESPRAPGEAAQQRWPRAWPLLLFVVFATVDLIVLRGGLHGPFVSDDYAYIVANPYLHPPSLANWAAFFDPASPAQFHAVGHYAPVHLLLHALEWQVFGDGVFGYHLVNVLVHAAASVLLVALLLRSGVSPALSLLGGAFFNLHPANVQAVVWISQLKSTAGLAFALGALLALPRRPVLATALFALGLLTKGLALTALPAAAAFAWTRGADRRQWAVIGLWTVLLVPYAWVEFAGFAQRGSVGPAVGAESLGRLLSVAAYGARYLVMAATSWGVSAHQEPDPVTSFSDPWLLAALPLGALLGARLAWTLWRREEEGAWWLIAVVSWVPISQVVPFLFPMADQYLYFVLPGLIGGVSLWLARGSARLPRRAVTVLLVAALVTLVFFGWRSSQRARLWEVPYRLEVDAARNFPNGRFALHQRARSTAASGDLERAKAALETLYARGLDDFWILQTDSVFSVLRDDPRFQELVYAWASRHIERWRDCGRLNASELQVLAAAHRVRGETAEARGLLEDEVPACARGRAE